MSTDGRSVAGVDVMFCSGIEVAFCAGVEVAFCAGVEFVFYASVNVSLGVGVEVAGIKMMKGECTVYLTREEDLLLASRKDKQYIGSRYVDGTSQLKRRCVVCVASFFVAMFY